MVVAQGLWRSYSEDETRAATSLVSLTRTKGLALRRLSAWLLVGSLRSWLTADKRPHYHP